MNIERNNSLQKILEDLVNSKKAFGASFAVKRDDFTWQGAAGDLTISQQYFIASTTKLFTTALILILKASGKLNFDDFISKFIDPSFIKDLHVYKGIEYSDKITVLNLLSHTSGLPDYFQDKDSNGTSLEDQIKAGQDQEWSFAGLINRTKNIRPLFIPGTIGKAHYSDTNFQLLGRIIENITGESYSDLCKKIIIDPLELSNTLLFVDIEDKRPIDIYFKNAKLHIPKAMKSFECDGGMVSTSKDMLTFVEAFFTGKLFPANYINELQVWNKIFFPMRSGIGIHLFKLPWIFNPTGNFPDLIGHSGLSGALAYCNPAKKLYIAGTVNQVAYPDLSFRTMIKLIKSLD
jgi:CubicO group peptidase (beta-lactamase class C family)